MKTLKQLKAFLDSLSNEQLEQELLIKVENGDSFGVSESIEAVKAKKNIYFAPDYFGFYTKEELKELGEEQVRGATVAVKRGGIFFNVKF